MNMINMVTVVSAEEKAWDEIELSRSCELQMYKQPYDLSLPVTSSTETLHVSPVLAPHLGRVCLFFSPPFF